MTYKSTGAQQSIKPETTGKSWAQWMAWVRKNQWYRIANPEEVVKWQQENERLGRLTPAARKGNRAA